MCAELRESGKVTGPLIVWTETPSNPLTKITDIRAVADMVHAMDGLVLVDSTWVTPWITQPLSLGADMVMHSLTKYIAGHSDLTGGCIVGVCPHVLLSPFAKKWHRAFPRWSHVFP
eukprot:m.338259 g.338259  ORF g.338259 m.338259 type:complete len:116 (-) comp20557_c0_seq36:2929-3276(-)